MDESLIFTINLLIFSLLTDISDNSTPNLTLDIKSNASLKSRSTACCKIASALYILSSSSYLHFPVSISLNLYSSAINLKTSSFIVHIIFSSVTPKEALLDIIYILPNESEPSKYNPFISRPLLFNLFERFSTSSLIVIAGK